MQLTQASFVLLALAGAVHGAAVSRTNHGGLEKRQDESCFKADDGSTLCVHADDCKDASGNPSKCPCEASVTIITAWPVDEANDRWRAVVDFAGQDRSGAGMTQDWVTNNIKSIPGCSEVKDEVVTHITDDQERINPENWILDFTIDSMNWKYAGGCTAAIQKKWQNDLGCAWKDPGTYGLLGQRW